MKTLTTSKMTIGEPVTVVITDVVEGKFGANYIAEVNGEATEIRPSGNLKFLADDLLNGKKSLNTAYTVTRVADLSGVSKKTGKAFTATQFTIVPANADNAAAKGTNSVATKLAAIRAKRTNA